MGRATPRALQLPNADGFDVLKLGMDMDTATTDATMISTKVAFL